MTLAGRSAVIIAVTAVVCALLLAGAGHAAAGTRMPAGAAPAGIWHTATRLPGTSAADNVNVTSVSCGSAGDCGAGGSFLASEAHGRWGTAIGVPGIVALGGSAAEVESVSCASASDCGAGGYYRDSSGHLQAFVVSEVNGRWGDAIEVPGTAALNKGGLAQVLSVSCASAGDCAAGGSYADSPEHFQAFVVSEVHGRWGTAVEVPGTAALNKSGWAQVASVSCAAAGDCAAGGTYSDASGHFQAFVVSEVRGRWGDAVEVPGTAALNKSGWAQVLSVSCAAAGDCAAGGVYRDRSFHEQAFVVSEVNGRWGTAVEVPGTVALNKGGQARVVSVSCGSVARCGAGGYYTDGSGGLQAFVVSEVNGRWATAIEVPGTAALNRGGYAQALSVSCASAGDCAAGGTYADGSFHGQAFVVSEVNGRWGTALEVPGTAALNRGRGNANAGVASLSCRLPASCGALGWYTGRSGFLQVFVASEGS